MAFSLPTFENSRCQGLTACGMLQTKDKDLIRWIDARKNEAIVAHYKASGEPALIRVVFGGTTDCHVHIDVLKRSFFLNRPVPKRTTPLAEIQIALAHVSGEQIIVESRSRFFVSINDLPRKGIARATSFVVKQDNLSIKMTGARFSIQGAPIQEINWFYRDKDSIGVDLEAVVSTTIQDDYLTSLLEMAETAFREFVLGNVPHA